MKAKDKKKIFNDIILIIFLCIVAGVACFFLYFRDNTDKNMQLQVFVDGEVVKSYTYGEDSSFNTEIVIDTGNVIIVENGQVYMKDADCPDGLCIKQGKISNAGESIICLPHKLVIRLVDISTDTEDDNGLDVMPR